MYKHTLALAPAPDPPGTAEPRLVEAGDCHPVDLHSNVIHLPPVPDGAYVRCIKPVSDRVIGALLLVLLSPLVIGIWVLVRWRNGGHAIFRQHRVGLNGQQFEMLKFRTMLPDRRAGESLYNGEERRHTHKSDADPRHTEIGRRLRRWSLDELPQLWNVVNGKMSLVGPRPELTGVVQRYAPWQHRRHLVKPGITGLWQVSARGSGLMMHDCTDIDLAYIGEISLSTDLKIVARTFRAAASGR